MFFLAWTCESNASNSWRAIRARTVPAQVRKSLAVNSSPVISRRYALTSSEPTSRTSPVLVDVLEQLLAGQLLASADDLRQPAIVDRDRVMDAALAPEAEFQARAPDPGVPVAHCRQAERVVVAGIFVVADADQGRLQQPDDGRQHLAPGQAGEFQVAFGGAADLRQRPAEGERPAVLGLVPHAPPSRVVSVLLPPPGVAARRLDVAVGSRADPDLGPGGRDHQGLDPRQGLRVADRPAVGVDISERPAALHPADPRRLVVHVPQARVARHGRLGLEPPLGFDRPDPRPDAGRVAQARLLPSPSARPLEIEMPGRRVVRRPDAAGLPSRHAW